MDVFKERTRTYSQRVPEGVAPSHPPLPVPFIPWTPAILVKKNPPIQAEKNADHN